MRLRDLWTHNATYEGPALGATNTSTACSVGAIDLCSDPNQCRPYPGFPDAQVAGCTYVDESFGDFAVDFIASAAAPLFLFYASHAIHSPLQVPRLPRHR